MNDLLAHPAIQSAIVPFIVAVFTAWLLRGLGWRWSGLAFALAYYISVYLAVGFQFSPLTSTRKILMLGIGAVMLGLALDYFKHLREQRSQLISGILFVFGAVAMTWVIWPAAARQQGAAFWLMLLPSLLYAAWLTASCEKFRDKADEGAMLALALGLGTGVSAMLGASALIGQLGIAIGAIAGAYLILLLFKQELSLGSNFMLPVGLLCGLLGVSAVVYASLPWYSLAPLVALPAILYIPVSSAYSKFKKFLMLTAMTLPLTIICITITWLGRGSSQSGY